MLYTSAALNVYLVEQQSCSTFHLNIQLPVRTKLNYLCYLMFFLKFHFVARNFRYEKISDGQRIGKKKVLAMKLSNMKCFVEKFRKGNGKSKDIPSSRIAC